MKIRGRRLDARQHEQDSPPADIFPSRANLMVTGRLDRAGIELPAKPSKHPANRGESNANSNAQAPLGGGIHAHHDPRLELLLETWERLDWHGRQLLLDAAERIAEDHG